MSDKSAIEWTDATWNPTRGCRRISPGCQNCYAEKVAARFSGRGLPYEGLTTEGRWNGTPLFVLDNLTEPIHWRRPRKIFVDSMSDLFYEGFSNLQIAAVFAIMAAAPHHQFQVLTKRPERALEWFKWIGEDRSGMNLGSKAPLFTLSHILNSAPINYPRTLQLQRIWPLPNVWIGVSVEDQQRADERIPNLLQIAAAVRFLSIEPLIAPVNLTRIHGASWSIFDAENSRRGQTIDWVIVGGESGPGARQCRVEWIHSIVEQCQTAGVPVFVKQLGSRPYFDVRDDETISGARHRRLANRKGGDFVDFPDDLRVRQFPGVSI